MAASDSALTCPHCGAHLREFELPTETGWGANQWVCFNDECSYFRDGWTWIWETYRAKASYRFRVVNPATGATSPLPVWSATAMRDRIVDDPGNAAGTPASRSDDASPEDPS